MTDLAADMRRAYELKGDTYSSMEVFGMLSRGAAKIEQLQAALRDARAFIQAFGGDLTDIDAALAPATTGDHRNG